MIDWIYLLIAGLGLIISLGFNIIVIIKIKKVNKVSEQPKDIVLSRKRERYLDRLSSALEARGRGMI